MSKKPEVVDPLEEWVSKELSKLLPQITETSWSEVWTVISAQASKPTRSTAGDQVANTRPA